MVQRETKSVTSSPFRDIPKLKGEQKFFSKNKNSSPRFNFFTAGSKVIEDTRMRILT